MNRIRNLVTLSFVLTVPLFFQSRVVGQVGASGTQGESPSPGSDKLAALERARGPEWKPLYDPKSLLDFLRAVAENDELALISVDWTGCPACGTGSPYIKTLAKLPDRYKTRDVRFGYLYWRDPLLSDDLRPVVTQSYKLFLHLTASEKQLFGGARPVETFTAFPPNWRPKFPQLFFLDGTRSSTNTIKTLKVLQIGGTLFHPEKEVQGTGTLCLSGDLKLTEPIVRSALDHGVPEKALLLQMTNYHLYRAAGDHDEDFVKDLFLQTCDRVVSQFERPRVNPAICFRFERER